MVTDALPDNIKTALLEGYLSADQRSALCRVQVANLITLKMATNAHLTAAAQKIASTFVPMRRATDPKLVSIMKCSGYL